MKRRMDHSPVHESLPELGVEANVLIVVLERLLKLSQLLVSNSPKAAYILAGYDRGRFGQKICPTWSKVIDFGLRRTPKLIRYGKVK